MFLVSYFAVLSKKAYKGTTFFAYVQAKCNFEVRILYNPNIKHTTFALKSLATPKKHIELTEQTIYML